MSSFKFGFFEGIEETLGVEEHSSSSTSSEIAKQHPSVEDCTIESVLVQDERDDLKHVRDYELEYECTRPDTKGIARFLTKDFKTKCLQLKIVDVENVSGVHAVPENMDIVSGSDSNVTLNSHT